LGKRRRIVKNLMIILALAFSAAAMAADAIGKPQQLCGWGWTAAQAALDYDAKLQQIIVDNGGSLQGVSEPVSYPVGRAGYLHCANIQVGN
jgi:hypothetical protein